MKNLWKWVLGIVLALVLAAGLFGLGFFFSVRRAGVDMPRNVRVLKMQPGGPLRGERMGLPHGGPMMMHGFDRGPFMPGRMFFGMVGRLLPFAMLLLLLYGVYQLGKGRSTPVAVPAAPAIASPPAPTTHPCPACDNAVQDDWKHCPNCGTAQA